MARAGRPPERRLRPRLAAPLLVPVCIVILFVWVLPKRTNDVNGETAAITSIRAIHTAEVEYSAEYGHYAGSIDELKRAGVLPAVPAAGGYRISLTSSPEGYVVHAEPLKYGTTGKRSFYSDQTMVVRQNYGPGPATAKSPALK